MGCISRTLFLFLSNQTKITLEFTPANQFPEIFSCFHHQIRLLFMSKIQQTCYREITLKGEITGVFVDYCNKQDYFHNTISI